jgi:hypothetical protein
LDEQLVRQLAAQLRAEGLKLTGEGGLLARLTKVVVESALGAREMIILVTVSIIRPAVMGGIRRRGRGRKHWLS